MKKKKNFKNGHDLLSPTGKLVLFWQMTIFVILIKVEFLSPQVRPVTRIGRWAPYRLFIPASISGTVKVLRYIDPLTRVKTRAWIKKYYFLTKFLKSILIFWSLSFPQCVLLDKFHSWFRFFCGRCKSIYMYQFIHVYMYLWEAL